MKHLSYCLFVCFHLVADAGLLQTYREDQVFQMFDFDVLRLEYGVISWNKFIFIIICKDMQRQNY